VPADLHFVHWFSQPLSQPLFATASRRPRARPAKTPYHRRAALPLRGAPRSAARTATTATPRAAQPPANISPARTRARGPAPARGRC